MEGNGYKTDPEYLKNEIEELSKQFVNLSNLVDVNHTELMDRIHGLELKTLKEIKIVYDSLSELKAKFASLDARVAIIGSGSGLVLAVIFHILVNIFS